MANVRLTFYGSEKSKSPNTSLECFATEDNEIFLEVDTHYTAPSVIILDIPTAIKLAKTLRTHINIAKGVHNG